MKMVQPLSQSNPSMDWIRDEKYKHLWTLNKIYEAYDIREDFDLQKTRIWRL